MSCDTCIITTSSKAASLRPQGLVAGRGSGAAEQQKLDWKLAFYFVKIFFFFISPYAQEFTN